jgi:hypothetical protein
MNETHYPVTDDTPGLNVRVVVVWAGREFKAARIYDKKTRAWRWATEDGDKLVTLPPKGQERRWGEQPDAWRPEHPGLWKAPLPEPLAGWTPSLEASNKALAARKVAGERDAGIAAMAPRPNRYAAMTAQADQSARTRAEIVAEVGAIEETPRAGDRQWWLTEALTYSAAGEVSVREAEGRVARAILTDGIRGREGGPAGFSETSSAMSGFIHETLLSSDADGARERFEPTPRDLDDYIVAFAWFTALNPPELWHHARRSWTLSQAQCVLVWRAITPALSWRAIRKHTGGSHEAARRVYGGAIAGVHRAANGKPVLQHVSVQDRMRALRERNRTARLEG